MKSFGTNTEDDKGLSTVWDIAESNVELLSLLFITTVLRLIKTSLHEHDYFCVLSLSRASLLRVSVSPNALCQVELTNESYNDFDSKSTISKTPVRNRNRTADLNAYILTTIISEVPVVR